MFEIIATSTFGVESVVAKELKELGYKIEKIENGKVIFKGDEYDIAYANIWLRTAERVFIKMAEFKAESFEELYQGTLKVKWEKFIPENGKMHIIGKSVKSKLFSVSDCQSIVKKAVVNAMKRKYNEEWFKEDGPVYKIEVSLLKDIVTLSIDTSGEGLHKRGYRQKAGEAPLKETLASCLVLLSNWDKEEMLIDPCCGSGTIPIEASLIAKNIAPGLNRKFISENWPQIPQKIWKKARNNAKSMMNDNDIKILGYDIDDKVLKTARENSKKAGVSEYIHFQQIPIQELSSKRKNVCVICNPPYGERMGEKREIIDIYKCLGKLYKGNDTWAFNVLTASRYFQSNFGRKAHKNRKLYNGMLKCYYYMYHKKNLNTSL